MIRRSKKARARTGKAAEARKRRKAEKRAKREAQQQADVKLRQDCFERDGFACVRCRTVKGLTPSHVLPKGKYPELRHDLLNVKTLCIACHLYWWHLNPLEAWQWFQEKYPDRAEYLMAKRRERYEIGAK